MDNPLSLPQQYGHAELSMEQNGPNPHFANVTLVHKNESEVVETTQNVQVETSGAYTFPVRWNFQGFQGDIYVDGVQWGPIS